MRQRRRSSSPVFSRSCAAGQHRKPAARSNESKKPATKQLVDLATEPTLPAGPPGQVRDVTPLANPHHVIVSCHRGLLSRPSPPPCSSRKSVPTSTLPEQTFKMRTKWRQTFRIIRWRVSCTLDPGLCVAGFASAKPASDQTIDHFTAETNWCPHAAHTCQAPPPPHTHS